MKNSSQAEKLSKGPISPYLFLFATKGFSCMLKAKSVDEEFAGIQVAAVPRMNHLLFADDIFFKASGEVPA